MPPALGVIMLDTSFARPVGDAGNAQSWPFPVLIERVVGAHALPVVSAKLRDVAPFVQAGHRLIERGAGAITTTCGFLVRQQAALQAALGVPVQTSALTQYARLQATLSKQQRVAILTIDATALDYEVRRTANIDEDALVFTLPRQSHFVSAILDGTEALDVARAEAEWVALAERCVAAHPDIGLWLFECANMPPYAAAVARATGRPVYDALALGQELYAAIQMQAEVSE